MSCMQKMKGKGQSGITMMSLVITVILVIILAMIFIPGTSQMPDEANYAKFVEEVKNVEEGVQRIRLNNASKGDTEEKINAGFKKVKLKGAPVDFQSFDKSGLDITGYVVDLEEIEYENAEFGKEYDIEKSELEFTEDDVYVYDSTGTVYYVKGTYYQGEIIHSIIAGSELGLNSTDDGPIISNIVVTSGELSDGTPTNGKAKIIVSAFPRHGGALKVMVREITASQEPDGTFATQVSRNGVYTIAVTEENGGRTVRKVTVSGIVEANKPPSNLSMIVNNGDSNVTTNIVDVVVRADGATKMMITKDNPLKPTSSDSRWEDYQTNFTYDLGSIEGRMTLYAWFKDEFSNVTDKIVKASIVYDKTKPTIDAPTLTPSGPYVIIETNQKDNIAPDAYILSKTKYGYKSHSDAQAYEDDYEWSDSKLVGPFRNGDSYDFVTLTEDEVGNKSMSQKATLEINFDYQINFDLNGGIGNIESVFTKEGEGIIIPNTIPTREGYIFEGWSENINATADDVTELVYIGESYLPTGNDTTKTLYAIWTPRTDMTYTVNHYVEKQGSLGDYELRLTETFNDGKVGDLAVAIKKEGGEFEGFVENPSHSQRVGMAEVKGDGSTVLSLYYYRAKYDLTVKGENATVVGTRVEVPFETEVTISATPNEGYVFDKWYIEGVLESSPYYQNFTNESGNANPNAIFKMIGQHTTITAKTKLKKYLITYELNGGTTTGVNPVEYAKDTPAFTLYNPLKNGYNFAGWIGTGLIQPTQTVTVNPANLVNMVDRHYEAIFEPTDELLTITAEPTEPTNGSVRAIISCIDKDLRIEYRVGTLGTWDMYASSINIEENTTIYARALKDGVVIDEETLVIDNIDKDDPEISDVSISEKWTTGDNLKVKVTASDNVEIYGYAVNNSASAPAKSEFDNSNDEIELKEGINYIWVMDIAGNTASHIVYTWDISENDDKTIYAFLKNETELVLKGSGSTKSYGNGKTPYETLKTNITDVSIEGEIESIGNNVLASMKSVRKIVMCESLKELKEDALIYTNNFETIEIASGNTSFVYDKFALYNAGKTSLYIHSNKDQSSVFEVPSSVTTIKKAAFYENLNLSSVKVTSNPEVEESAFEKCRNLYQIDGVIGGTQIANKAFAYCENLHILKVSDTLEVLGEAALSNTTKLGTLELPKTLKSVYDTTASKNGVFELIGALSGNIYNKGVVRYYESAKVMHSYAQKYPSEAHFERIDDVAPEIVSLNITDPATGTYAQGTKITFEALFNENLGVGTDTTLPVLKIKIGTGVEKTVSTAALSGDRIIYTYIIQADDFGKLELVSYTGTVKDTSNNVTEVVVNQMGGSEILVDTVVRLVENGKTIFFGSIQQAVDAAMMNGTTPSIVTLLKQTDEQVVIPSNKNISLNLNEQTFYNTSENIAITNNGKLEVSGPGVIDSAGTIILNKSNANIQVYEATLKIESVDQVAIENENLGSVILGEIQLQTKVTGIDNKGQLYIYNSNMISEIGPILKANSNSKTEITDSEITSREGYGLNILLSAEATISSSIIIAEAGTGINNEGKVKIDRNSEITGSIALNTKGEAEILNSILEGNDSERASLENAGTLKVNNSQIKTLTGSALKNKTGNVTMVETEISTTAIDKNAIENSSGATLILNASVLTSQEGKALMNEGTAKLEENTTISSELANIIIENKGTLEINNSKVESKENKSTTILNSKTLKTNYAEIISKGVTGIENKDLGQMTISYTTINVENDIEEVVGILAKSSMDSVVTRSDITAKSTSNIANGIKIGAGGVLKVDMSTVYAESTNFNGYGVYNVRGTMIVGTSEDFVSEETPIIEGSSHGYYSSQGNLKFYDGQIIGNEEQSIVGTITDKPAYSYVEYIVNEGREKALLKVDQTAPTGVILEASTLNWSNLPITLYGEAFDGDSGIWKYALTHSANTPTSSEWVLTEGSPLHFTLTIDVTESNIFYLHVMDQSENIAVSDPVETKYDKDAPVIKSLYSAPTEWTSGDVTITITAEDTNSGISGYEFTKLYHDMTISGESYVLIAPDKDITVSQTFDSNGLVHIYVYDQAGNVAYQTHEITKIDKTNPSINIELYQYGENVTKVKVTGVDNESGMNKIYMNGVEQTTTGSGAEKNAISDITYGGTHEFKVEDNVSNSTAQLLQTYEIVYDSISASGSMPYQIKIKDLSIPLLENRFEKPTFEFIGWNTERDYTGTIYQPNDEYAENSNTTLYAMWKDTTPPDITDAYIPDSWSVGERMKLEIESTDNVDTTGYAITTDVTRPTNWSSSNVVEFDLGHDTYYVWAVDGTGNAAYEEVYIYDLSDSTVPNSVAGILKDFDEDDNYTLSVEGKGIIRNFASDELKGWETKASNITELIINDGITQIGSFAFGELTKVDKLTIGYNVVIIAMDAFLLTNNYSSLTVTSPNFVVEEGMLMSSDKSRVYIASTKLTLGDIVLPDSITTIAPYTFANTLITSIYIPDDVTIQYATFYYAKNLKRVYSNDGVGGSYIGNSAFEGCESLEELDIAATITSLGTRAFYGTNKLTNITIPKIVTIVQGNHVFVDIGKDAGTDTGKGYVYYYDSNEPMRNYATNSSTKNQATFIGIDDIKPIVSEVTIENGKDIINRQDVKIKVTATDNRNVASILITEDANVDLNSNELVWVEYDPAKEYEYYLDSAIGEHTIYVWAKDDAGNISEVAGMDSIILVLYNFEVIGGLEVTQYVDLTGKDYYQYIERGYNLSGANIDVEIKGSVKHRSVGKYNIYYVLSYNGYEIETITKTVDIIANSWKTEEITEGKFTYVIHTSGKYAKVVKYSNASSETTLVIPEIFNYNGEEYKVIDVGNGISGIATTDNTVKEVILSNNVIAVSANAFSTFKAIANIEYSDKLMTFGEYSFANSNSEYATLTLKENVREVKEGAFSNTIINGIVIENGVKSIEREAFYTTRGTYEGRILEIPGTVSNIGPAAFAGYKAAEIIVSDDNSNYSSISNQILVDENQTTIYQYALGNSAMEFNVPEGIVTIEEAAFMEAEILIKVTLDTATNSIKAKAFKDTINMGTIENTSKIKFIGEEAFANSSIRDFEFGDELKNIGSQAFKNTQIKEIHLPKNIAQIDSQAFAYNQELYAVVMPNAAIISGDAFKESIALTYLVVLDNQDMVNVNEELILPAVTDVYVASAALKTQYENDVKWGTLTTYRIKLLAELIGGNEIGLVDNEVYSELGITLLGENLMEGYGTSSIIPNFEVELESEKDSAVNGTFVNKYYVKYNSEVIMTLERTIRIIDTEPPTISDIITSSDWELGTVLKVDVIATDNRAEDLYYAVTNTSSSTNAKWSTSSTITLSNADNYIHVKDVVGNTTTIHVGAWDMSRNVDRTLYVYTKPNGELVVTGSGTTRNITFGSAAWKNQKSDITKITIEEGVISLGSYILSDLPAVEEILIPSTLGNSLAIATNAFAGTNNFNNITIAQGNTGLKLEGAYTLVSSDSTIIYMHSRKDPLTTFTIGDNRTIIAENAFYKNNNLNTVEMEKLVEIKNSAFEGCLNLTTINGEIGNTEIGSYAFSGDINLKDITISKTVTKLGKGIFTNVLGPVRYYASCGAMKSYVASYQTETNFIIIDDVFPTNTKPTVKLSSSTIMVTSKQEDIDTGIVLQEYIIRLDGEEYDENNWQTQSYYTGLNANTKYYVKTRATDGAGNVTVSLETVATTKKVPESINITAVPAGATSGDVTVIVEWPVADMEALYGEGWPEGTDVVKQIGIKNPNATDTIWTNITDDEATYSNVVTENGYVFFARLYDGYNYTAQTISLTVNNIDRIAPTGTVFINNDDEEALENAVKLKLTATDNRNDTGFGVKYYYASENSTLDLATAEWKQFNGNGEYTFELQGTTSMKTVYVWFKDAAGNISGVCSDDVLLITDNVRLEQDGITTYYLSLVDAIDATNDNPATASKITIIRNLSQDGPYQISPDKNIVIDMRGNNISYTGTGQVVLIKNNGLLSIMNSRTKACGLYAVSNEDEAIAVWNLGHLEVIGVSVYADSPTGKSTGIKNFELK